MREYLHPARLIKYSMWWRIFYGIGRLIFGGWLLLFVGTPIADAIGPLLAHELTQDPNDLVVALIRTFLSAHPYVITYFLAGYFIFWGIIDIVLSINVIRGKMWALPLSIGLILCFVALELVRLYDTRSMILVGLVALDMVMAALMWRHFQGINKGS